MMVRNYIKKTERQKWNKQSMNRAVSAVIEGKMGYRKASLKFKVPKTTLERYVKKLKNSGDKAIKVRKPGSFKAAFTEEQEKELCKYMVDMEQRFFGLTSTELRSLAFQLAERNGFNPFNKETQLAGVDWLHGFLQRHPNISFRKPEATSARTMAERSRYPILRRLLSASSLRSGRVISFNLADIGEGIRDVTVKEWYVKPGDRVNQFDKICDVESDKAAVTITSRYDGLVKTLHYKVDDVAMVGSALCDIEIEDDSKDESTSERNDAEETVRSAENQETDKAKEREIDEETDNSKNKETEIDEKIYIWENKKREIDEVSQMGQSEDNILGKVLATPAVRRIAKENNIKLKDVIATGKEGRVLKEDILAHLQKISADSKVRTEVKTEALSFTNVTGKTVGLKGYSKHMWKTMTKSLSIPHFVYSDECNVNQVMRYRNEVKDSLRERGVSLTLLPFFVKAASLALEQCPKLNAWLDEESQTLMVLDNHNIGIAMDTPEGLVVPNIKNVQNLSVHAIARELNRLQECGSKSSIPLADLTGTTFTLSNIGVVGGTYTKPVILPPQVIIGAFGKAQKLPRFDDKGNVVPASIMSVSWSADHRVVDGVTVAKFSNLWKQYVENPAYLLIDA